MQRHISRVVRWVWLPAFAVVAVLGSDMDQAIMHADKNIHTILTNVGWENPPEQLATYVWTNPVTALLVWAMIFVGGAGLSWCIEAGLGRFLKGSSRFAPSPNSAFGYDYDSEASRAVHKPAALHELSDDGLKEQALRFAKRIRAFGMNHTQKRRALQRRNIELGLPNGSVEMFMEATSREFEENYRGDGRAILEELRKRTGTTRQFSDAHALDHGSLAGPNPIEDSAAEIERLARKL